jgi:hypothetical protein
LLWCLWKHLCLPTWRRWYWWGVLGLDSGLWLWVCLSLWWTLPTSLWFCTRCVWVVKHWFLIASCCPPPPPPGSWIRKSQNKKELLWLPNCFLCNFTHGSGGYAKIEHHPKPRNASLTKKLCCTLSKEYNKGGAGHRARCDSHHWDQTVYGMQEYLAQEADCCP